MPHWTLDDIPWQDFDPARVDPALVPIIKAASLVEYNAADYVRYLREIFKGDEAITPAVEMWGEEEIQHGGALRRWAELADPAFDFEASLKRFVEGYQQVPLGANGSVRGSLSGELTARCIVEMGTSNYYTAIKEHASEPVLNAIAAHIAADELRHYKLFYTHLKRYVEREKLTRWGRLKVALRRVAESDDDELAYAYYASNAAEGEPYDRKRYSRLYARAAYPLYRRQHVESMAAMLFKAVGFKPHSRACRATVALGWRYLSWKSAKLRACS